MRPQADTGLAAGHRQGPRYSNPRLGLQIVGTGPGLRPPQNGLRHLLRRHQCPSENKWSLL